MVCKLSTFLNRAGMVTVVVGATVCLAEPPSNDACLSAIDHVVPPAGGVVTGTVIEATNDGAGCGSNRLPSPDVYHSFIPATRGPWRFDLCETTSGWDTVLSIHRDPNNPIACPTTAANRIAGGCDDDGCSPFFGQVPSLIRAVSLEPGVRYTIRIAGFDGGSVTDAYQLVVTDLNLPNDRCEDAGQHPISGAGGFVAGDLSDATTDGAVDAGGCLGSTRSASVRDVFHLFTPQTSGRWTISTCVTGAVTSVDTVVSIHSGCPATAANAIACNNDGCESQAGASVVSADLVAGVTYRIRVAEYLRDRFDMLLGTPRYAMTVTSEATGACCSPTLGVCEVVVQSACAAGNPFTAGAACEPLGRGSAGSCAAGAYNDCAQAVALGLDEPVQASTAGLTGSAVGSCSGLTADGWFTFTAPVEGTYQLRAQPAFSMLGLLASIYPGTACPASAAGELDCGFIFGDGAKFTLGAGESVKIRIAATEPGRYVIRVTSNFDVTPVNDLCPDATAVVRDVPAAGSFAGASGNLPMQTCSSGQRDVWYSFTAPSTGRLRVIATPAAGSLMTTALSVSATCADAEAPIACAGEPWNLEDPTEVLFTASAGVTYRVRVSTNSDTGDFTLLITNAPAAPGNDACANATTLAIGVPSTGTTRFAEGSAGAISEIGCSAASSPDTWFKFRPAVGGAYEITVTPSSPVDASPAIGVYAGCPGVQSQDVACVGSFVPGLPNTLRFLGTANTDYLIRTSTTFGAGADFDIAVSSSTAMLGACCGRDGGCYVTAEPDCTFGGGVYRGDGAACGGANCPPSGRCCFSGSSACAVTSQSDCAGPGATFTAGAACDVVGCPAGTPPANDLCQNAPTLTLPAEVLTALDLADAEGPAIPAGFCGTPQSIDLGLDRSVYYRFVAPTSGAINFDVQFVNFPEPMVVLYRGTSCGQLVDVDCTYRFQAGERRTFEVIGGETYYLGLGLRNDPTFVNEGGLIRFSLSTESASGACCRGTACTVEMSDTCAGTGAFQGAGSACGPAGNPTTCCPANFNDVGGVTVQDIFDFLGAYFTGNAAADFNGSGGVTVQDIFDFLNAYFVGCP